MALLVLLLKSAAAGSLRCEDEARSGEEIQCAGDEFEA
jgi:hypothetical protein